MKLILFVLLSVRLVCVLSNPIDNRIHTKLGAIDSQRKPRGSTDIENGQRNHLQARDEQFVLPQEIGNIQQQVRLFRFEDLGHQSLAEVTGNTKSRSLDVPTHEHLKNGDPVKCCSEVGEALVIRSASKNPATTTARSHFHEDRVVPAKGQLEKSEERIVKDRVEDFVKDLGNVGILISSPSLDHKEIEHQDSPQKELQRLKRENTSKDSKDKGVTEQAVDIKIEKTTRVDNMLTVHIPTYYSLEIKTDRIKRLDSPSITNLLQLKEYVNKEITTKIDSVELEKSDIMKKRQEEKSGTKMFVQIPEETESTTITSLNAPKVHAPFLSEAAEERMVGTIPEIASDLHSSGGSEKQEVKIIKNAEEAKIQSKSKDCHHNVKVKHQVEEETAVDVEPVDTDSDGKLAEKQQSDRDVKSTRKQRSVAIIKTIDDVTPQSLPLLVQDAMKVMYEVDNIDVDPEINSRYALSGDLHRINRTIEIIEADMKILVEGTSIAQNGQQQQDIRERSKRQSHDDFAADYYTNLNEPKPSTILANEDRANSHFAQTFQVPEATKQPHSGSNPDSHLRPAVPLDNPLSTIINHPQICSGSHQIIVHGSGHCPVLTCRNFYNLKYEWLLCVYGPMSRVVVLGDSTILISDNILGNYPSLQCACDMGFVMNKMGECVRGSDCEESQKQWGIEVA